MNKRVVIKTVFICFGIFLLLCSAAVWSFMGRYELDTEKKYRVLVAKMPIEPGMVIDEGMLDFKTIKESAFNSYMVISRSGVEGMKSLVHISPGDYIRDYTLLPKEKWFKEDDRIIVLPMEVEERLANLIKKDTYIDIKLVHKDLKLVPQLVLTKVKVQDVLDESGVSLGESGANKKAYACLILDEIQRNRLYTARELGSLIFELYCDAAQEPPDEEFQMPEIYADRAAERLNKGIPEEKLPRKAN